MCNLVFALVTIDVGGLVVTEAEGLTSTALAILH
jgi:hypothetical protein